MILEKAIFVNRAPFERLELDFKAKGVNVLTAINGKGKTTIISHIVDALYDLAQKGYRNEFEGKENKYYRVSTPLYNLEINKPSFVYFRFLENSTYNDYIDIRNDCSESEYDEAINLVDKIQFQNIQAKLKANKNIKHWEIRDNSVKTIFERNVLTYFPAYRYEKPSFLNDPYTIKLKYSIESGFAGYLPNPIEVVSDITELSNWIMDLILDIRSKQRSILILNNSGGFTEQVINSEENEVWKNLNTILSKSLYSKIYKGVVRFGIGERNYGATRICIMNDNSVICPSVFYLSSGELAILALFGEILRQADNYLTNISMHEIAGIVLIDEVDKHLHISLQKDILPRMFKLFPNVQFIVSSHSPFLNMGLAEELPDDNQIIDLDNGGFVSSATTNSQYQEVYEMMLGEKQKYTELYHNLKNKIKQDSKPLIVTEGKTDSKHIKAALKRLNINLDVEFYEIGNQEWGNSNLYDMLDQISKVKQNRVIIGVFDRDSQKYIDYCNANTSNFKEITPGNNVYAFCIPLVNETLYGNEISIEHYYNRNDLLKKDSNGRRLFLGDEFFPSANSKDGKYQTKIKQIQHKIDCCGIIDDKVYSVEDLEQKTNIALTKNDFADLVLNTHFSDDFDFSSFTKIIDIIKEIIGIHEDVSK